MLDTEIIGNPVEEFVYTYCLRMLLPHYIAFLKSLPCLVLQTIDKQDKLFENEPQCRKRMH